MDGAVEGESNSLGLSTGYFLVFHICVDHTKRVSQLEGKRLLFADASSGRIAESFMGS